MQIRALKSLVQISRVGSFSAAAEQLGMTLSALSMQMKSLEQTLGVILFDRSIRPPQLTPIGKAIVAEALPLLRQEEKIVEICHPHGELAGQFRIGFVTTAAVRLLPDFLLASNQAAPLATFEFETGLSAVLQDKVISGQLDAAVITDAEGLPNALAFRELRQEPFVFAADKSLMAGGLPGLLSHHTFFHFMPNTGIGKLIEKAMLDHKRAVRSKTIVLDNLEAIMGCVAARLGFTLLPIPDVERYRTDDIGIIAAPGALQRKLVFVTLRESNLDRHAEWIAKMLGP